MGTVVVFVPNIINKQSPGYLTGFFNEDRKTLCKCVYVLGTYSFEKPQQISSKNSNQILGVYSTRNFKYKSSKNDLQNIWLSIICTEKQVCLSSCFIEKRQQPLNSCIVVTYDINSLMKSELILYPDFKNKYEIDHFKILANHLQIEGNGKTDRDLKSSNIVIDTILVVFSFIYSILARGSFILQYSVLMTHLKNYAFSILWSGQLYKKKKFINLKVGNYLMSMALDILAGLLVYFLFNKWKSADEMFDSLSFSTKYIIDHINDLVRSLMGSPAGLKLNQPLSNLLGSLVLYYLDIWWAFLSFARPILELAFLILIKTGFLGLTFQLAVCADVLAIISFHVYCIYIYAARLYEIQAKGLYSLSRLVLGRKRNPEPGKIDSCPYSTEELLIGTISFAVLLFLLPTTLVYYVVFTGMHIGVIVLSGLFKRTIYFMQTLPVYTTFLWLFFPSYIATTVKLTPSPGSKHTEHISLIANSAKASWLQTMKLCIPDALPPPKPTLIGQTMWKVITGKLI